MEEPKNKKCFIRLLITAYIIFLIWLVVFIVTGNNPPRINSTEITVLFIIAILVLSESFDSFSLGKLFTITREVKKKEQEIDIVKKENNQLRGEILSFTTTMAQNQAQNNTTINGIPVEVLKHYLGVVKSKDEPIEPDDENADTECVSENTPPTISMYKFRRFIEKEALKRYFAEKQISDTDLIRKVEFSPFFNEIDPIADQKIIFDGYLKTAYKEYFFYIKMNYGNMAFGDWTRIYVLLSKIFFYRKAKKVKAELILLLAEVPREEATTSKIGRRNEWKNRFLEMFQPAITNNLLRIEIITFTRVCQVKCVSFFRYHKRRCVTSDCWL